MTPYTAIFSPFLCCLRFFGPLYGYGYRGTHTRIGTVRIQPYPVYRIVLSPNQTPGLVPGSGVALNLVNPSGLVQTVSVRSASKTVLYIQFVSMVYQV